MEAELKDQLDEILGEVREATTWQKVHAQRHDALEGRVAEHHAELYGQAGSPNGGIKASLQQIRDRLPTRSWWQEMAIKVAVNVVSWSIVGLIAWMLWLNRAVPH